MTTAITLDDTRVFEGVLRSPSLPLTAALSVPYLPHSAHHIVATLNPDPYPDVYVVAIDTVLTFSGGDTLSILVREAADGEVQVRYVRKSIGDTLSTSIGKPGTG